MSADVGLPGSVPNTKQDSLSSLQHRASHSQLTAVRLIDRAFNIVESSATHRSRQYSKVDIHAILSRPSLQSVCSLVSERLNARQGAEMKRLSAEIGLLASEPSDTIHYRAFHAASATLTRQQHNSWIQATL